MSWKYLEGEYPQHKRDGGYSSQVLYGLEPLSSHFQFFSAIVFFFLRRKKGHSPYEQNHEKISLMSNKDGSKSAVIFGE
jgi:hypothetical protein